MGYFCVGFIHVYFHPMVSLCVVCTSSSTMEFESRKTSNDSKYLAVYVRLPSQSRRSTTLPRPKDWDPSLRFLPKTDTLLYQRLFHNLSSCIVALRPACSICGCRPPAISTDKATLTPDLGQPNAGKAVVVGSVSFTLLDASVVLALSLLGLNGREALS